MTLTSTRNLLEHSFYRRWVAGTLTLDELRDYAGQYAHVVRALPGWLRLAGESAHAAEEERHLELWRGFAAGLALAAGEIDAVQPNATTGNLLAAAGRLSSRPEALAAAWAVESQSAAVSEVKLAGLAEHYGIDGAGAEYFRVHAALDVAHTAELEAALDDLTPPQLAGAQAAASLVQDGLWNLLTSVERAA